MKSIKKLVELIDEELNDSEKYARLALKCKDEKPELAAMYYSLSLEEMKHMNTLHNEAVREVKEAMEIEDPRTEGMKIAYDILHEQAIEKQKNVAVLQQMYRE